ncbi:MAG: response regulator [Candidatus Margulisiibacteriota bacterium]
MSKADKILVVDDEQAVCDVLKKFLGKKGYTGLTALSGQEALEIIKNEKPKIVLLDIRMPEMNGIEVLKKIREIDQQIGIVMITAVHEEETAKKCIKLGAYDYITKPFGLEYLENVLMVKLLDFDD